MGAKIFLAAALALFGAAAAQSQAPARRSKKVPALKPVPAAEAVAPAFAPPEKPAPAENRFVTLVSPGGALGAALLETPVGLRLGQPLAQSPAEAAGLTAGDRLMAVGGKPAVSASEASSGLSDWPLGARLSAVVVRGLETRRLETPAPPAPTERARAKDVLSAQEQALKQRRLDAAAEAAAATLRAAPALEFTVHARQAFWLRFPSGISEDAAPGAVLLGETTTAVATSSQLDFLSLPPRSRVWARVLSIEHGPELSRLRLHLFKLQPAGGHAYRVSGIVTDFAGGQKLAKVTPGGTLVLAAPLEPPADDKPVPLVSSETRLRAEMLEPTVLTEAPSFYRAGAGLWLRTKETAKGRRFEISHVIAGRSADRAGLKVGQAVTAVGGRSAAKLAFADALDALYGPIGTDARVTVEKADGKSESLSLKRGALYKDGAESVVPPPFQKP